MKKLLALMLTTVLISSSAFATAPSKIDTSIGVLKTDQPLAEFIVDMDKLKADLTTKKQAEVLKKAPLKKGIMPMQAPKIPELKIINANDLPENQISQGRAKDYLVEVSDGKYTRVPADQVVGKSVTITKKQLMEADMLVMQGALLKNFRVIGKAKDGGDIMAIDIMQLYSDDGLNETPVTGPYFAGVNAKEEPDGIKPINGTNVVPAHGEYELSYYTQGQKIKDVNVGQWYTIVWGNTLDKWVNGMSSYSLNDFNYLAVGTNMQNKRGKYGGMYFVPATNATQLIITDIHK